MSIYDFQATTIYGKPVEFSEYRGKVLLIVNTASKCSFSSQFADLQKLYERRKGQGFEILAFPCNQFNKKEPDSHSELQKIYQDGHGLTFPLFEKTDVRGSSPHPLFQYLIEQAPFQGFDPHTREGQTMEDFLRDKYPDIYAGDGIKWNFSKFLIDRDGRVRGRFEVTTELSAIEAVIQSLL